MPRPAPDRLAAAEATLRTCFAMSGYIRRRSATRLTTDGSTRYHKGDEVRLVVRTRAELARIRQLLALFGLRPGQPFRQVNRLVQPVYGREAVGWFGGDDRRLGTGTSIPMFQQPLKETSRHPSDSARLTVG
ncbi:MAG: hypothetical protein AB7N73_05700 [Gemmatimonadales bacterium]